MQKFHVFDCGMHVSVSLLYSDEYNIKLFCISQVVMKKEIKDVKDSCLDIIDNFCMSILEWIHL